VKDGFLFRLGTLGICFLIFSIFGCATVPTKPAIEKPEIEKPVIEKPAAEKDPFRAFSERYRKKAMEYEAKSDVRNELQSWKIVRRFSPDDQEVAERIADIKAQIHSKAESHFEKGLSYLQDNSTQAARKEFLLALSYNPDHRNALDYLKHKLAGDDYTLYEVTEGETLKKIALKVFNDSQKDFIIAYFNDLDMDARLVPGMNIRIPVLESIQPEREVVIPKEEPRKEIDAIDVKEEPDEKIYARERLKTAKIFFNAKKYQKVPPIAGEVLEYDPKNKEARDLINESYYKMGIQFSREKKYREALSMFERADPGYKDVVKETAYVKKSLAEEHYKRGVKYFLNEELYKAIQEWEKTLSLDPELTNAKEDIEKARSLLEKLKKME
jgi:tetratricopeptide (TPR) repeat protein